MDVVAAFRQLASKLGTDDAAAAVGRVNCNADIHTKSRKNIVSQRPPKKLKYKIVSAAAMQCRHSIAA